MIISPNEVCSDIMVLASPPAQAPDDVDALFTDLFQILYEGRCCYPPEVRCY